MRRKIYFYLFSFLGTLLLLFVWIFFLQRPTIVHSLNTVNNNNYQRQLKIENSWNSNQLDHFISDSLGLYIPLNASFWLEIRNYQISAAKLEISNKDNVFSILKKIIRSQNQTVNTIIHSSQFVDGFAKSISDQININADSIRLFLGDTKQINQQIITPENWPIYIIPNTYNLKYNTSVEGLFNRLIKESQSFWNGERLIKLKSQNLTQLEAVKIASIVEKESNKKDEFQTIAGVYLNRYRKGMKLQADPTIVFIKGKAERVLKNDTKTPSPYNTYLHEGLMPGPICIPSIAAIDAVLDYKQHNYLYFCARADFSGYHVFESNYSKHLINARDFHNALNKKAGN